MTYRLHFNSFLSLSLSPDNIRLYSSLLGSTFFFFKVGGNIKSVLLSRESILDMLKENVSKLGLGEHFNAWCSLEPLLQSSLSIFYELWDQPYDLNKAFLYRTSYFFCMSLPRENSWKWPRNIVLSNKFQIEFCHRLTISLSEKLLYQKWLEVNLMLLHVDSFLKKMWTAFIEWTKASSQFSERDYTNAATYGQSWVSVAGEQGTFATIGITFLS